MRSIMLRVDSASESLSPCSESMMRCWLRVDLNAILSKLFLVIISPDCEMREGFRSGKSCFRARSLVSELGITTGRPVDRPKHLSTVS